MNGRLLSLFGECIKGYVPLDHMPYCFDKINGKVKKMVVLGALGAGKRGLLQKITADGVSTKASPTVGLRI